MQLLAGAAGQGKTTLAMALAATASRGGQWPDETQCTQGDVVIWSGEDDPADTLVPRLAAAGADLQRIHFVDDVRAKDGEPTWFDPAKHMLALEATMSAMSTPSLLVIDPIVSTVGAGTDSHKNTEVRKALQPVVDLARRVGCAVLGITHFTKGTGGRDPTERVTGSLAFSAVARVVMVAAKDNSSDQPDGRVLARSKSNIGPDEGGFAYTLCQVPVFDGISASAVRWGQRVDGNAKDLLAAAEAAPTTDGGKRGNPFDDYLRNTLADGPVLYADLKAGLDAVGLGFYEDEYLDRELRKALKRLNGDSTKQLGVFNGGWLWHLPGAAPHGPGWLARSLEAVH